MVFNSPSSSSFCASSSANFSLTASSSNAPFSFSTVSNSAIHQNSANSQFIPHGLPCANWRVVPPSSDTSPAFFTSRWYDDYIADDFENVSSTNYELIDRHKGRASLGGALPAQSMPSILAPSRRLNTQNLRRHLNRVSLSDANQHINNNNNQRSNCDQRVIYANQSNYSNQNNYDNQNNYCKGSKRKTFTIFNETASVLPNVSQQAFTNKRLRYLENYDSRSMYNSDTDLIINNAEIGGFQSFQFRGAQNGKKLKRSPLKNLSAPLASYANIPHTSTFPDIQRAQVQEMSAQKRWPSPDAFSFIRPFVQADVDKSIHLDDRALIALLRMERFTQLCTSQFHALQKEINQAHRRAAIAHMHRICMRENSDAVVLPLAVSYMDRILNVQFVPLHNLAALANASLFLSMKMKAPQPPKAIDIVDGCQQSLEELKVWEEYVACKLEWNLSTSTAFEHFDQLMVRAPILETLRETFAYTLNAMLKDLQLAYLLPSLQAAVCLLHVADDSGRAHLIRESEAVIRKCFRADPPQLRFKYAKDLQFAINELFFDEYDTSETSHAYTVARFEETVDDASVLKNEVMPFVLTPQDSPLDISAEKFGGQKSSEELLLAKDSSVCDAAKNNAEFQSTLICEESSFSESFEDDANSWNDFVSTEKIVILSENECTYDSLDAFPTVSGKLSVRSETFDGKADKKQKSANDFQAFRNETISSKGEEREMDEFLFGDLVKKVTRPVSMPILFENRMCNTIIPKSMTVLGLNTATNDAEDVYMEKAASLIYSDDGIHTDENSNSNHSSSSHSNDNNNEKFVDKHSGKLANDSGFSSTVSTPEPTVPTMITTTTVATTTSVCVDTIIAATDNCFQYSSGVSSYGDFFEL